MKIATLRSTALAGALIVFAIFATALFTACSPTADNGIPSASSPTKASPSGSPGSADPGESPEPSESQTPDAYAYAACMREHGIDMSDPDPKTGLPTIDDSVDPQSAKFLEAQEACGHLLPGGIRGEQEPTDQSVYLEFAQCMRENGMPDFPDPQPGSGEGMFPGADRNDPAFAKAAEKCQHILAGEDQ